MATQKIREVAVYAASLSPKVVKLKEAAVYAAVRPPSTLRVRSLSALVLSSHVLPVNVKMVTGCVLESMRSQDYSKDPIAAMLAALNREFKLTLSTSTVALAARTLAGDSFFDAEIVLTAKPGSKMTGQTAIRYRRYPISDAFKGLDTATFDVAVSTTVHALLPQINTQFHLALTTDDVADGAVNAHQPITLQVIDTSIYFRSGDSITLGGAPPLASAIVVGDLTGFDAA